MESLPKRQSTCYTFRKGRLPCSRSRHVPALSTQEAAALVWGIIEARLEDGWRLDQIDWRQYCRDSAVVQVVTDHLADRARRHEAASP